MVEVDGETMTPEEYNHRQGKDKKTRPDGYKEDLDLLKDCPKPRDPEDDGPGL